MSTLGAPSSDNGRRFDGCTAVVTGGTSGIGHATAQRLHREGANVVIAARDAVRGAAVARDLGDRAVFVPTDVTDPEAVDALMTACVERFDAIDVLVNSAGRPAAVPAINTSDRLWSAVMRLNLDAVFRACRAASIFMIAAGHGSIVNISSIDGVKADSGFVAYNAAKAGVINLTRSLALELAVHGIRANAVSPGSISTPLADPILLDDVFRERVERAIPIGRMGRSEEVAAAVCFLASDDASFITGENLVVDGGMLSQTGHPSPLLLVDSPSPASPRESKLKGTRWGSR